MEGPVLELCRETEPMSYVCASVGEMYVYIGRETQHRENAHMAMDAKES